MTAKLFTPLKAGALTLPNRVVMAPLTRNRARADGDVPGDLAPLYYAQRASAGLIVTEATQVSPMGKGYDLTPGIYSAGQVEGWKRVVDAVHAAGGRIAAQLWHVGRISHADHLGGAAPLAPSAIRAETKVFVNGAFVPASEPRALAAEEIPAIVEEFRRGASNAMAAGFDAVEIHGANGYLIDQFLRDGSNRRDDEWGGPAENRTRFLMAVAEAVAEVAGADRTGLRLSPFSGLGGIADSDPLATFGTAIEKVSALGLAYLHMVENGDDGAGIAALRRRFRGVYIANWDYDRARAIEAVQEGRADAIAFGKAFLANPDLPRRLELGAPLNDWDRATFYGGDARGYTDYPFLDEPVLDENEAATA